MHFANDIQNETTEINRVSAQDVWQMPTPINLDSSGLRWSSRTLVLNRRDKIYSHTTQMIQEDILPASLGLRLAKPTLPMALDPLGSSTTLPVAFDPLGSSTTLPMAFD